MTLTCKIIKTTCITLIFTGLTQASWGQVKSLTTRISPWGAPRFDDTPITFQIPDRCLLMDPPSTECVQKMQGHLRKLMKAKGMPSIGEAPGKREQSECATKEDVIAALREIRDSVSSQAQQPKFHGPDPRVMDKQTSADTSADIDKAQEKLDKAGPGMAKIKGADELEKAIKADMDKEDEQRKKDKKGK